MNKTRFLFWAVVVLALLNVALIGTFLLRPKPGQRQEGPRKFIIKRLHFDAEQVAAYDQLIEHHRTAIRQKQNELAATRKQLYMLLRADTFPQQDSLTLRVGDLQVEIEHIHLQHFLDLKRLCHPDQKADFDDLAEELEQLFSHNPIVKKSPAKK